jgi:branched-chain amino acid transport system substrate-binding protein
MTPVRRWSPGAWLVALLLAVPGCTPAPRITIGTGLSVTFVDAARMAFEEEMARGGLPSLDTLLLSESTNRAEPALEIAARMAATSGMVAVIGHSNSSSSLSASPIYNQAGIVQIAPTATSVQFSEAGSFSFRLAPADPMQGELLAGAIDSLYPDGTRVAILFVNDDYGRGLRAAVLDQLDRERFPVVFDQPHADVERSNDLPFHERAVQTTIAGVADAEPGLVLWLGRPATFRGYLPEMRRVLGAIPVLGGDALSSYNEEDLASGLWDGVRYADYVDMEGTEALRDFARRFLARQGIAARTAEVLSYDAMGVLLAAVRDGARTGDEVRQWLQSLGRERPPWQGLSGPIAFTERGDVERPYVLVTMPARSTPR